MATKKPVARARFKGPGWPRWPDTKGVLVGSSVALTFYILDMIRNDSTLLGNASFMQFAGVLVGGSFLLISSAFFQNNKDDKKDHVVQTLADKVPPQTGDKDATGS